MNLSNAVNTHELAPHPENFSLSSNVRLAMCPSSAPRRALRDAHSPEFCVCHSLAKKKKIIMLVYIPFLSLIKMVAYCRCFSGMFPPPSVPEICPCESCLWQEAINCGGLGPLPTMATLQPGAPSSAAGPLRRCSGGPLSPPALSPPDLGPLFMGTPFFCCLGGVAGQVAP